jgi:hypothetical protein
MNRRPLSRDSKVFRSIARETVEKTGVAIES